jgi:hypothetical protein
MRHGLNGKRRVQYFFYCWVCIRFHENVFTDPLPSNDRGDTHTIIDSKVTSYTYFHSAAHFLIFKKIKVGIWHNLAVCVSICVSSLSNECQEQSLWNLVLSWHLSQSHRRTSWIPQISLCPYVYPHHVPRKRLGTHVPAATRQYKNCWTRCFACGPCRIKGKSVGLRIPLSLLGNGSVNTFQPQRRIVEGVVFLVFRAVSKESRRLLVHLPRTSCWK